MQRDSLWKTMGKAEILTHSSHHVPDLPSFYPCPSFQEGNEPMSGFSLRIFLPDGSPDGLRLVEKSNWTGRGIVCPRPLFPTARALHSTLKVLQEEGV
jgi:hypothetical protein